MVPLISVGKGKERAIGFDEEEDERLHRSSVMGKGKSKRKQVDHVEDGNAILEHSSQPLIIHLLQMHLHIRGLSRNSRVLPLFLDICAFIAAIIPSLPSYPSPSSPSPGTAAMTSNSPSRIMENPSESIGPSVCKIAMRVAPFIEFPLEGIRLEFKYARRGGGASGMHGCARWKS